MIVRRRQEGVMFNLDSSRKGAHGRWSRSICLIIAAVVANLAISLLRCIAVGNEHIHEIAIWHSVQNE